MSEANIFCKICGAKSEAFAKATLRKVHSVQYFACPTCDFIQPEAPHWLAESYASAINQTDIGYASRNLELSKTSYALIRGLFDPSLRYLDYGAGYGLFVRLMRDKGLNYFWHDKYCQNLFAQGFEAEHTPAGQYEMVTCFEVMEHTIDPLLEIEKMLCYAPTILFSTLLIPYAKILPKDWWYYGLDHGQHVSLFSRQSLRVIAQKLNLHVWSKDDSLHLLSRRPIATTLAALCMHRRISPLVNFVFRRPSLLSSDFEYLKLLTS